MLEIHKLGQPPNDEFAIVLTASDRIDPLQFYVWTCIIGRPVSQQPDASEINLIKAAFQGLDRFWQRDAGNGAKRNIR